MGMHEGIERARTIVDFIEASSLYGETTDDPLFVDLVADILHLARVKGMSVSAIVETATGHVEFEVDDDDDDDDDD